MIIEGEVIILEEQVNCNRCDDEEIEKVGAKEKAVTFVNVKEDKLINMREEKEKERLESKKKNNGPVFIRHKNF